MKIWLDDQLNTDIKNRQTPQGWVGAQNSEEFKRLVEEAHKTGEEIFAIDWDNDLGEELEGVHLLKWYCDTYPEMAIKTRMLVHTENETARREMVAIFRDLREKPQEFLEKKNRPSYEELFGELEKPK
ncbi:MAG: hypothetical protein HYT62_02415 [Candidatus Yanofskybacteria bacterium]|nr:hypothetical protein [Candidatus Yanofskybacteria bacterium]